MAPDGEEHLRHAFGIGGEIVGKARDEGVLSGVVARLERGKTLDGAVGLDDGEQEVAVAKIVAMAHKLLGPDLGEHGGGVGAALGVGREQVGGVGVLRIGAELQEDLLLGGHIFVERGARPAEMLRDGGERYLVVGMLGEELCGGLLDLGHALPFLLIAACSDKVCHAALHSPWIMLVPDGNNLLAKRQLDNERKEKYLSSDVT